MAEGQVGGDLDRAAYAHMPSAVLLVQMGVDPFDPAALAVAYGFGWRKFALLASAWVVVDERYVPTPVLSYCDNLFITHCAATVYNYFQKTVKKLGGGG